MARQLVFKKINILLKHSVFRTQELKRIKESMKSMDEAELKILFELLQKKQDIIMQISDSLESEQTSKAISMRQQRTDSVDVAVIGVAVKTSLAANTDEYWSNLKEGRDCIREFPQHRKKDLQAYFRGISMEADKRQDSNFKPIKSAYLVNLAAFAGPLRRRLKKYRDPGVVVNGNGFTA